MIKNPCVVDHRRSNNKSLKNHCYLIEYFELTFILIGYFPSPQELSYCPCQHILGHKQRTDEKWKTMLSK